MARTVLQPTIPDEAAVALTATAADTVNQNRTPFTGREIIIAHNSHATTGYTVTITSAADKRGRLGHITGDAIAAGAKRIYGPFPADGWKQPSDGHLWFEANNASVLFSVIRIP